MSATTIAARPATTTAQPVLPPRRNKNRRLRAFFSNGLTRVGVGVLGLLVLLSLYPMQWLAHDPFQGELILRFRPPVWLDGGTWEHPLGTDNLGRDIISRLVLGGNTSLFITFTTVPLAMVLGTALGTLSGYFGGKFDSLIMRLVDVQLAFPNVLLVIAIVAVLGSSVTNLILVLTFAGWVRYPRVIRGSILSIREREFVEAARALGSSNTRIILRHILPNVISPVVVLATFELARMLLLESTLSFLGVGIQPPGATWGSMIADGRNYLTQAWWLSLIPGTAIALAVLAFNFVGDGLRDALDPRLNVD